MTTKTAKDTHEPTGLARVESTKNALATQAERLGEERATAAAVAVAARSKATIRAYDCAWRQWATWCEELGVSACPPDPKDVCAYLTSLATEGLSYSTIELALKALKVTLRGHNVPGWEPPRGVPPEVRMQMAALARIVGKAQKGKDPVRLEDLRRMMLKTGGADNRGLRDRALLLVHFWGAFRRSEVVFLDFGDVSWSAEGVLLTLRRSKTDQTGIGRTIAIHFQDDDRVCACTALRKWIAAVGSWGSNDPLFRRVDRFDNVLPARLSAQWPAMLVKKYAERAGLDPERFAGHSMRAGFVTAAAMQHKSLTAIMRQTGHHDVRMVQRYIRVATPFEDNPTEGMARLKSK